MLTRLVHAQLARAERRFGAGTLEYGRDLWRRSRRAFAAFGSAQHFLGFRGPALPRDVYHLARLAATQAEDCGTCVQVVVRLARADGVPAEHLRAALDRAPERLPAPLADAYRFAAAVAAADDVAVAELLPRVEGAVGAAGVGELAVAIAGARVFPTTKRALGLAVSCSRVEVVV